MNHQSSYQAILVHGSRDEVVVILSKLSIGDQPLPTIRHGGSAYLLARRLNENTFVYRLEDSDYVDMD